MWSYFRKRPDSEGSITNPKKSQLGALDELDTLFGAAIIGDDSAVLRLIKKGLDVNYQDTKGETALHWAAQHGSLSVAQLLLEEGAKVNLADQRGATPLHYACETGNMDLAALLVHMGADINARDRGGSTPLHWAVSVGKIESVAMLIEQGANMEIADKGGVTALQLAAYWGRIRICELLIDKGAKINYNEKEYACTPLHSAAEKGFVEVVELLIAKGADVNKQDETGFTPLHLASKSGHKEVVRVLLMQGSCIDIKTVYGQTAVEISSSSEMKNLLRSPISELDRGVAPRKHSRRGSRTSNSGVVSPRQSGELGSSPGFKSPPRGLSGSVGGSTISPQAPRAVTSGPIANPNTSPPQIATSSHSAIHQRHGSSTTHSSTASSMPPAPASSPIPPRNNSAPIVHQRSASLSINSNSASVSATSPPNSVASPPPESFPLSPPGSPPPTHHIVSILRKPVTVTTNMTVTAESSSPIQNSASASQIKDLDLNLKSNSSQMKMAAFLRELQMEQYIPIFVGEEFDFESLKNITEKDLVDMGVKIGSRRKLLTALHPMPKEGPSAATMRSWEINYAELALLSEAGEGFYGAVYKGMWNNAEVAIKKIFPSKIQSVEKWLLEVEFLSTLRHPNVVVFYGACTAPPNLCIVTEWVPKGSLRAVLADPAVRMDPFRVLSFSTDIARGLAFLHSHDPPVIHRDLKSENLLVTNNWRVKLTDFGLSRFKDLNYSYLNPSHPFDVTIAAPEVLEHNHLSERADVFSFGLILWELVTRKKPYASKNPHWVAKSVITDQLRPPMPLDIPPLLSKLTEDCWAQEAKLRPTAKDIIARLEEIHKLELAKPAKPSDEYQLRISGDAADLSSASMSAANSGSSSTSAGARSPPPPSLASSSHSAVGGTTLSSLGPTDSQNYLIPKDK